MKITLFLSMFLLGISLHAQIAYTSFEEPQVNSGSYIDQGDANLPHDLVNNENEPLLNWQPNGKELGFNARYVPYDDPDVGLTDGDAVGVTDRTATVGAFPDGLNGYEMSDCDGNFILEFNPVDLTNVTSPTVSVDFFLTETGYEGDGVENQASSDRLRIYAKDLTQGIETDLLNTTGNDINDLSIEGSWITAKATLQTNTLVQLVIEGRTNAGVEAFFFDQVIFDGDLSLLHPMNSRFKIYPNPIKDELHIKSQYGSPLTVVIYDILGREVLAAVIQKASLPISDFISGVYFIKITQNTYSEIKKIVIQ